MHGTTRTSSAFPGVKTRHMSDIVAELSASLRIHAEMGSRLGGAHLELTGDITEDGLSVTECLGGSMRLEEEELGLRFESYCDRAFRSLLSAGRRAGTDKRARAARLNFEQAPGASPCPPLSPPRAFPPPTDTLVLTRPLAHADIAFLLSQSANARGRVDARILEELASRPGSVDSRK